METNNANDAYREARERLPLHVNVPGGGGDVNAGQRDPTEREPAYGAAAVRYQAERELGRRALEILREWRSKATMDRTIPNGTESILDIQAYARSLGLLDTKEARP